MGERNEWADARVKKVTAEVARVMFNLGRAVYTADKKQEVLMKKFARKIDSTFISDNIPIYVDMPET